MGREEIMIFLDKHEFGQFLRRKRMKQDINLDILAEGLCSFLGK